jgi:general secretion pathway protein G
MIYLRELSPTKPERGDAVRAIRVSDRRVARCRAPSVVNLKIHKEARGFTLIELVITITILTIMTMGVVPLIKLSVKRQKEQQLHDTLRQIRTAIDEFHRDTVGMNCTGTTTPQPGAGPTTSYLDPRSKVVISDCTIFGVDNPDRYPPDLETLVSGVNVVSRAGALGGKGLESTGTSSSDTSSVLGGQTSTKTKVYLRSIPIDPISGKPFCVRSSYDPPGGSCSGGGENIFDVYSPSDEKALNGDKYSDW